MKIMSAALIWKITELLDNDDDDNNVIKLVFIANINLSTRGYFLRIKLILSK